MTEHLLVVKAVLSEMVILSWAVNLASKMQVCGCL